MKIVVINDGVDFKDLSQQILQAVEKGLDEVAAMAREDLLSPTQTWQHQPEITIDKEPHTRTVGTDDKFMDWTSNGTSPHPIRPRRARILRWNEPFSPKTKRGSLVAMGGGYGDDIVVSHGVDHPGTEARNFDGVVADKYQDGLAAEVIQRNINEIP